MAEYEGTLRKNILAGGPQLEEVLTEIRSAVIAVLPLSFVSHSVSSSLKCGSADVVEVETEGGPTLYDPGCTST